MPRPAALLLALALLLTLPASARDVTEVCPDPAVLPRPNTFTPGGIILTTFDRFSLWVVDIDRQTRYPLPNSRPCATSCALSTDMTWITYLDAEEDAIYKMRLDGRQQTYLASSASEVRWWDAETLLLWTPTQRAYLIPEAAIVPGADPRRSDSAQRLDATGVVSIQPGGYYALRLIQGDEGERFNRVLVRLDDLDARPHLLGEDLRGFNAAAWSPDGTNLAYVQPRQVNGQPSADLYTLVPGQTFPRQWTSFTDVPVRIGGQTPVGGLSWSPDGQHLAFWVTPVAPDAEPDDLPEAALHVLDLSGGTLRRYCGVTTTQTQPNPPRLIWSPDSTHIAFGTDVEIDPRGVLLFALNVESGVFYELSAGIYPALGAGDVIAWGRLGP